MLKRWRNQNRKGKQARGATTERGEPLTFSGKGSPPGESNATTKVKKGAERKEMAPFCART